MFSIRWFSTIFMIFLLTACGGGGSIEKNSSGDGGTDSDDYALALTLNSQSGSSELSVSNPIQIQAKVTKDGEVQADRLVKFVGDEFSDFNGASSALTNSDGVAVVGIVANSNQGAGTITASFDIENQTVTKSIEYAAMGDGGVQIALTFKDASGADINTQNPLAGDADATIMATLTNNGVPIEGKIITFTFDELLFSASNGRIVTDANGQASTSVKATKSTGAGEITATYDETTSRLAFDSDGNEFFGEETYVLELVGQNAQGEVTNNLSLGSPISIVASLTLNGNPLADQQITWSIDDKAVLTSENILTTNEGGQATATITDNNIAGSGTLTATYNVSDSLSLTQPFTFTSTGDGGLQMSITVQDQSGATINEANPLSESKNGRVVVTLTNNGEPVSVGEVTISSKLSKIQTSPPDGIDFTDENGMASVDILPNDEEGADTVVATYIKESTNEQVEAEAPIWTLGNGDTQIQIVSIIDDVTKNPVTADNTIAQGKSATVTARVIINGTPATTGVVFFETTSEGTLPVSTAELNENGEAQTKLFATTTSGLGRIRAGYARAGELEPSSFSDYSIFHSEGDAIVFDGDYAFDIQLLTGCNDGWDDNRDTETLNPINGGCQTVTNIRSSELPELFVAITRLNGDATEPNEQIVEVQSDKGQVLPSTGRALTDKKGVALLKLQPGDVDGAGTVTVTFNGSTGFRNFSVGVDDLYLQLTATLKASDTPDTQPLPELDSGDSFIITARVSTVEGDFSEGALYTQPVDVGFSSVCVNEDPNLASIDATVRTKEGVATSTYRTTGCNGNETITASIASADPAEFDFFINDAPVQAIQFLGASESFIGIPPSTSGVPVTSEVKFLLVDTDGNPMQQKQIEFRLADLSGAASLTSYRGNTTGEGEAVTIIKGGVVPGDLVVEACYLSDEQIAQAALSSSFPTCWQSKIDQCTADSSLEFCDLPDGITSFTLIPADEQVNAVSSGVVLSSGVPDQDSFGAAPAGTILNAQGYSGVDVDIFVYFGDQFNQLTANNLVANVQSEAGIIGNIDGSGSGNTYECSAVNGVCRVQWRSQGSLPFTDPKWQNRIGDVCDTYKGEPVPCIGDYPTSVNGRTIVRGARVSILATAKGQENFHDKPSSGGVERRNGIFDIGEFQPRNDDLAEAFIDFNQDNVFDPKDCGGDEADDPCEPANSDGGHNEVFIDGNNNGLYDVADGIYNGLLCGKDAEDAGQCTKDLVDIRRQFELIASSDVVYARFVVNKSQINGADCTNIVNGAEQLVNGFDGLEDTENANYCDIESVTLGNDPNDADRVEVEIYYSDLFGNSLPAGTEISIGTTNGVVNIRELTSTIYTSGGFERGKAVVEISQETTSNSRDTGNLIITFEIPGPFEDSETITRTKSIIIRDDG
ncbi:Ig-like domain-containing protein [Pseudoalteromonas umbrosa]|uniref:Ig-like domain-containing protein n=1 Tax=Pseudoalteromonas umbrosa TaxID=3048489 RepID=UPI0024C46EA2|nr:Ig-like domain-containing protein [Pseudoalteromonas sp. B95]MDK1286547.1 Ig-like domain-containing protein [Pseudoalteromonas sp. B95]